MVSAESSTAHQIGKVGSKLPTSPPVGNHPDYQPIDKIID